MTAMILIHGHTLAFDRGTVGEDGFVVAAGGL